MTLGCLGLFVKIFLVNLYHNTKFRKLFIGKLCLIKFIIIILMLIMKNA